MRTEEFFIGFESLLTKTKSYGNTLSSDLLVHRLLDASDIQEQQQQLARVTVKELTVEEMKSQPKKIFGDSTFSDSD